MNGRDWVHFGVLLGVLAALLSIAAFMMQPARPDRDWKDAFARTARFSETGTGAYRLSNLRNFAFSPGGAAVSGWTEIELSADDLAEVWFFLEPFPSNSLFGHSFLSFVFETPDGARRTVSVSIEARQERGERYSPLKGAIRGYELAYVWSTEKDILTRIAVGLGHTLYAYRVDLDKEQITAIFEHFAARTNALAAAPRYYNTVRSNCTNELAKAVNEAFPGALPWGPAWIFTGAAAEWLFDKGFLETGGAARFEDLNARAEIRGLVEAHRDAPAGAFAEAWRKDFEAER